MEDKWVSGFFMDERLLHCTNCGVTLEERDIELNIETDEERCPKCKSIGTLMDDVEGFK